MTSAPAAGAPEVHGRLVVVGTPIGNLGDLSPRAVEVLESAQLIACEDTRRTRKLLAHAGVAGRGRLLVVNDHTEVSQVSTVLAALEAGSLVAVVSDAGMPAVSDPGERLVRAAAASGHEVVVVPGPSAALAALVVSGLPTGRFVFEGFLPRKGRARRERLAALATEQRTTVLFEAPGRVRETIGELSAALGGKRDVAVCRELTKMFEEVWRGTLDEAAEHLAESDPRGEHVLVVGGAPPAPPPGENEVEAALLERIGKGSDKRSAVAEVAAELAVPKREVYDIATRL